MERRHAYWQKYKSVRNFSYNTKEYFERNICFSVAATKEPALRPKGMGLGANKMANSEKSKKNVDNSSELVLKKGAYAKITAGHNKGSYCEVLIT